MKRRKNWMNFLKSIKKISISRIRNLGKRSQEIKNQNNRTWLKTHRLNCWCVFYLQRR
nr:MAG TPA: hypothetical protein [Caudoviricetes sp.]